MSRTRTPASRVAARFLRQATQHGDIRHDPRIPQFIRAVEHDHKLQGSVEKYIKNDVRGEHTSPPHDLIQTLNDDDALGWDHEVNNLWQKIAEDASGNEHLPWIEELRDIMVETLKKRYTNATIQKLWDDAREKYLFEMRENRDYPDNNGGWIDR